MCKILVAARHHHKQIAGLHYLTHTDSFRDFADESWIAARRRADYLDFWDAHLRNQGTRERSWVALHGNQIIGTTTVMSLENSSRLFRPSCQHGQPDETVGCLRLMYVHPGHFRRGVGTRLLREALDFMQGERYEMAVLITHAANTRARRFYRTQGWHLDGLIDEQVEEFFDDPASMRLRARYRVRIIPEGG